jgi:hypothetical protein
VRDLPTGPELLSLARDVLLHKLLPLLPPHAHLDARLVANSLAIAEREAKAGGRPQAEILAALELFFGKPRKAGDGQQPSEEGVGEEQLLRRFARELRAGLYEPNKACDRKARDIMWRLTIAKLREANPRFLNANGFE